MYGRQGYDLQFYRQLCDRNQNIYGKLDCESSSWNLFKFIQNLLNHIKFHFIVKMWCVCVNVCAFACANNVRVYSHSGFTTRTEHTSHTEGERGTRLRRAYYMNETQKSVKFLTVDRYSKINLNLNKHFSTLFANMKYGCLDGAWVGVSEFCISARIVYER